MSEGKAKAATSPAIARWVVLVVLGGAGLMGAVTVQRRSRVATRQTHAQNAWRRLERCLLGPTELPSTSSGSIRMRSIELGLLAHGPQPDADTPWPLRCRLAVIETLAALKDFSDPEVVARHEPLASLLEIERSLSESDPPRHSYLQAAPSKPAPIDRMMALARELKLDGPCPTTTLSDPPRAAEALLSMLPQPVGSDQGYWERMDAAPNEQIRFNYGSDQHGGFACTIDKPPTMTCARAPGQWSGVARPLSHAADSESMWVWDLEPKPALMDARAGTRVELAIDRHAFVRADGHVIGVREEAAGTTLVHHEPGGEGHEQPLPAPPGASYLGQRADVTVWLGEPTEGADEGSDDERPLWIQPLPVGDESLPEPDAVGAVPYDVEALTGACRRGDRLALVLRGPRPSPKDAVDAETTIAVAIRQAGRWQVPAHQRVAFRRDRTSVHERWNVGVSCPPDGVVLTWLRTDQSIAQLACTSSGCAERHSAPLVAPGTIGQVAFAAIDDRVALVMRKQVTTPLSVATLGLLFRFAPVGDLASVPQRVLIADENHGGVEGLHNRVGLIGNAGHAAMVFGVNKQLYALHVASDGEVTPLETRWTSEAP
jgi:hypothetical protein